VLRLWRDQVRIALCPDRLIVMHYKAGLRPHIISKQIHKCSESEWSWQGVLPTLQAVLNKTDFCNADATLILSNHFVRYLLLPWSEVSLTNEEKAALLQDRFQEVYGEVSATWELRLNAGSFGSPSLASGVDQSLLVQAKNIFDSSKLRLISIQPYLMSSANDIRRNFKKGSTWFVVIEEGMFCIALLHDGQWKRIRSRQIEGDWLEETLVALEREMLLDESDGQGSKVWVYAPDSRLSKPIKHGTMVIEPLLPSPRAMLSTLEMNSYAIAVAGM
jgi:hypothetical protein